MKKYNNVVFIGRFQPFHDGHESVIKHGLSVSKRIIILVGSSYESRTIRNPFTTDERASIIRSCFTTEQNSRISIIALRDDTYNEQSWIRAVQDIVSYNIGSFQSRGNTALIGMKKDSSSYYLDKFPQWESVSVPDYKGISSTNFRTEYFEGKSFSSGLSNKTIQYLNNFKNTSTYKNLVNEYVFIEKYKSGFSAYPYPPTFNTVDAVVIQSGHILLVKRGASPGKGLLALPGGFINQYEKLEDAMLRELVEETRIKLPQIILKRSITDKKVFDAPYRSMRGRTITHAYTIELNGGKLPKVKGSDDAVHASWIPLSDLDSEILFEDHYHIIKNMVKF